MCICEIIFHTAAKLTNLSSAKTGFRTGKNAPNRT
jgi:hypothetical protein